MIEEKEELDWSEKKFIDNWHVAEARRFAERVNQPYDGILGALPDWMPSIQKANFIYLRDRVLDRVFDDGTSPTPAMARNWIVAYVVVGEKEYQGLLPPQDLGWPPDELSVEIGLLAQMYAACRLGEVEGMKFLVSNDYDHKALSLGKRQQRFLDKGPEARKGKFGPVRQMVERLKPHSLKDLILKLQSDAGLDLLASLSRGPIDFDVDEVDEEQQIVLYRSGGQDLEVTFKTLANHIASMK